MEGLQQIAANVIIAVYLCAIFSILLTETIRIISVVYKIINLLCKIYIVIYHVIIMVSQNISLRSIAHNYDEAILGCQVNSIGTETT